MSHSFWYRLQLSFNLFFTISQPKRRRKSIQPNMQTTLFNNQIHHRRQRYIEQALVLLPMMSFLGQSAFWSVRRCLVWVFYFVFWTSGAVGACFIWLCCFIINSCISYQVTSSNTCLPIPAYTWTHTRIYYFLPRTTFTNTVIVYA